MSDSGSGSVARSPAVARSTAASTSSWCRTVIVAMPISVSFASRSGPSSAAGRSGTFTESTVPSVRGQQQVQHLRQDVRDGVPVRPLGDLPPGVERDGQAPPPVQARRERGAHRARVQHRPADVGAVVDPRQHDVRLRVEPAPARRVHDERRGPLHRVRLDTRQRRDLPPVQPHPAVGTRGLHRRADPARVLVRRRHHDLEPGVEGDRGERVQPRRVDAVVVGDQSAETSRGGHPSTVGAADGRPTCPGDGTVTAAARVLTCFPPASSSRSAQATSTRSSRRWAPGCGPFPRRPAPHRDVRRGRPPRRCGMGAVLVPWPNRTAPGAGSGTAASSSSPLTEPAAGNAIHGLLRHVVYQVGERARRRHHAGGRDPAAAGLAGRAGHGHPLRRRRGRAHGHPHRAQRRDRAGAVRRRRAPLPARGRRPDRRLRAHRRRGHHHPARRRPAHRARRRPCPPSSTSAPAVRCEELDLDNAFGGAAPAEGDTHVRHQLAAPDGTTELWADPVLRLGAGVHPARTWRAGAARWPSSR